MLDMRALGVYVTVLILLAVALGAGVIAANWPGWCRAHHWCAADFGARPGTGLPPPE
jgi:hypothetical protein